MLNIKALYSDYGMHHTELALASHLAAGSELWLQLEAKHH